MITDPRAMTAMEDAGFGVGSLAFGASDARDNAALGKHAGYRDLVEALQGDLASLYAKDKAWGVGMRYSHRGFDSGWLTSPHARWELAAVVNRPDRRIFAPGTCGEIRFIYRLAYSVRTRSGPFSSRLPATLNAVFFLPDDGAGCSEAAFRLRKPLGPGLTAHPKSVEVDIQTARWPSTVRPDLGGHADYVLRVFHKDGERYRAAGLENTPDAERIRKDPAARADLLAWARANAGAAAAGTSLLPERFLALRAVSVTPHGLERPANRPWTRLFRPSELNGLAVPADFLLRRLDGLTCMGCHQSRSLAGFHIVGEERDPARRVDALAMGVSPHVEEDLPRRLAYIEALAARRAPDEKRPPAEHATDRGGFGDACGLVPDFAAWTCGKGFACRQVDGREVGQCMPEDMGAGSACRPGAVDFAKDGIPSSGSETRACGGDGVCEDVNVGFPGGMCATACEAPGAHGHCGAIAILQSFNECLARGGLFTKCAENSRPAGLRACGAGDPCRPDYLCSKTQDGGATCLPPYFVLQMRVDGHPKRP
jgi:hypothetical protein